MALDLTAVEFEPIFLGLNERRVKNWSANKLLHVSSLNSKFVRFYQRANRANTIDRLLITFRKIETVISIVYDSVQERYIGGYSKS